MKCGQGVVGKQGGAGTGGGEAAEDVGRRLALRQRADQAAGGEPVGQAGGKLEDDFGTSDQEKGQVGRSSGGEIERSSRNASNVETASIRWASSTTKSWPLTSACQGGKLISQLTKGGLQMKCRRNRSARPPSS